MRLKGVCYDIGTVYYFNWRPNFDPEIVQRELEIIKADMHCNAVKIGGFNIDRLMITAEDALRQGLEV
jgi:hydroxymethylpyrimidine/phosphomethylpyrimidine kinase